MTDVAQRERAAVVGPLFFWELVRQSRKGRGHWPRLVYAAALLVILFLMLGTPEITQKNAAYLSEFAAQMYLVVQYGAILVLTPFSVAGAFIEERQQNTLTLLLTTSLTAREIVLGKLLGRLIHVAAALLAGLPILGLLQLLGGVNVEALLVNSSLALVLLLVCGMYAIRASLLCHTVGGAIFMTYGMLVAGYLLSMVIAIPVMAYLSSHRATLWTTIVIWWSLVIVLNLLFALLFLRNAIAALKNREPDRDYGKAPLVEERQDVFAEGRMVVVPAPDEVRAAAPAAAAPKELHRTVRWKRLPGVWWNWPVTWKDTYFPLSDLDVLLAGICCGLPLTVFLSSLVTHETFVSVGPFILWCCDALLMLLLVTTTLRAAGTFSKERLQQTLMPLLGMPLSRWIILGQVWLGSITRFYAFALGTGVVCLLAGIHSPWFLAFHLPVYTGQLAFFTLLGVFLSVGKMTPFQARFFLLAYFFAAMFVLPAFLQASQVQLPSFLVVLVSPYSLWFGLSVRGSGLMDVMVESFLWTWLLVGGLFVLAERRLKRLQESL